MLTPNSKIIKRMLSISMAELLTQKTFKGLSVLNWYDRVGVGVGRHGNKSSNEPFTGIMILNESKDEDELSKSCLFKGHHLGPEIFANYCRSFFAWGQHGIDIELNIKAFYNKPQPKIENLIGSNPSIPEKIELWIFGVQFYDKWYRAKYASKFSVKFFDKFIHKTLTQKNLIEAFERDIDHRKDNMLKSKAYRTFGCAHKFFIDCELLRLFKSINNFDSFLNDEMNRLKVDFKGFKTINSIYDCVNLLFIYNPLFKAVIDYMFKQHYYGAYANDEVWYGDIDPITKKQLDEKFGQASFNFKE